MVRRRGRIRTCNIRFQRPSCCQLHHPPICRFARPPTRWTPSAGPDVTGTARHCDHPQTLAVPRQGGCRGDPSHGSGARRAPHARRVAYLSCFRRDLNPRPSAPEADALSTGPRRLVSSAVPTAVHGPDTHRAWNRTTNRDRHHNPVAAPHPVWAGAAPPHWPLSYQYLRPAVCTTGSQRSPALDSRPRQDSNLRPDG